MNDYLQQELSRIEEKITQAKSLLELSGFGDIARREIAELERQKEELLTSPNKTVNAESADDPDNPAESRNVILEISGAAGGEEAKLWANELLRMYGRYASSKKWDVEPLDEKTIMIRNRKAFETLKFETGVHRVQRVPVTESSGRIHTSTATVSVLPELEDIDIHINPDDLEWDFFRSGGHGGQNVNKVSTAVRLRYKPSNIIVTCQAERYQGRNREIALQMLRAKLWEAEEEKRLSALTSEKRLQIGRGTRSEKIRTYNFPQSRVTDHRLGKSWHNLEEILEGKLDDIISALKTHFSPAKEE